MENGFKNVLPTPSVPTKYKFVFSKEDEEELMTKFEEASQEPSDIVSQVRHDLFRSLIIQFFQEKFREWMKGKIDPLRNDWKDTNAWVVKVKKTKILKSELHLVSDIDTKAEEKDKLKGYKTSTVDISIDEEEFEWDKKSFSDAKFPLKYVSGISKKLYADYKFGKSFVELEFEYTP
nr:MAG TPA: hypothetical protein [Caudoviricetes sp.]